MDSSKAGQRSDCTRHPASGCTPIQWPGERTTARHELEPDNSIQNWFGSLVDDMRDASGQMYRRNRYYDPHTGQFTQPDPIGLAGGLNAYGFAAGAPVSYDDPYGLRVEFSGEEQLARTFWNALVRRANAAQHSRDPEVARQARALVVMLRDIWDSEHTITIHFEEHSEDWNRFTGGGGHTPQFAGVLGLGPYRGSIIDLDPN